MTIYMSASYPRKAELRGYRIILQQLGHDVTSEWLNEIDYGDDGVSMTPGPDYCTLAERDVFDIDRADSFMAFTEPPNGPPRGGRHVEYGIAVAKCKKLFVIGYRENAFHHLPHVLFFDSFDHFVRTWGHVQNLSMEWGKELV